MASSYSGFVTRKQEQYYVQLLERLIVLMSEKILGGSPKERIRQLLDGLKPWEDNSNADLKPTETDFGKLIQEASIFDAQMVGSGLVLNTERHNPPRPMTE